jgi:hypothetical protein
MVIATGRASQESALAYMRAMFDISQNTLRAVAPDLNPVDPRKDSAQGADMEAQPIAQAAKRSASRAKDPNAEQVAELKQRLAELETVVAKLSPKKAPRKKR